MLSTAKLNQMSPYIEGVAEDIGFQSRPLSELEEKVDKACKDLTEAPLDIPFTRVEGHNNLALVKTDSKPRTGKVYLLIDTNSLEKGKLVLRQERGRFIPDEHFTNPRAMAMHKDMIPANIFRKARSESNTVQRSLKIKLDGRDIVEVKTTRTIPINLFTRDHLLDI
jgi:hypothetical protein